jgi:hypothetical protein
MRLNPFSTANSFDHIINPKIVSSQTGFQVAVDLVDIDTTYTRQLGNPTRPVDQAFITQIGTTLNHGQAYFTQIGSTGPTGYVGDAYFNALYYNQLIPFPGSGGASGIIAGPGISVTPSGAGQIITANVQAGSGIRLNVPGNGQPFIISSSNSVTGGTGISVVTAGGVSSVTSTVSVTGSNFINVQQNGETFVVSYTGLQGGGTAAVTGVSGSYAVFDSSGNLTSSTVLKSTNVVGPTGQVMLYSPQGPTSSSVLSLTRGPLFSTLNTPILTSSRSDGRLSLTPNQGDNSIQSSGRDSLAFPLSITDASGGMILTTFNVPQGLVSINPPRNIGGHSYPYGVQVKNRSALSQTLVYPGGTYNVYLWGGGGNASTYPGGAGGFVKVQNIYGETGLTFAFNNVSTVLGGGNSMQFFVNGVTAAVAPGGGGGGTAGPGAAYGEPGGSYPGQGYSAVNGAATGGIFTSTIQQPTYYTLVSPATVSGGVFENIPVQYGLTGYLSTGTKIRGFGTVTNVIGSTFATYYFPPGSTLIFQTNGITFEDSTYNLSGVTGGLVNTFTLPVDAITGGTLDQTPGGTASTNTLIGGTLIQGGFAGGTFTGDSSGIDQMLIGQTFSVGQTGITLTVNYGTAFTDFGITGGIEIDFSGGLTFTLSRSLGEVIAPKVFITDPITISSSSVIQVAAFTGTVNGSNGTTFSGGASFGGGGLLGGGGGIAGGGGGAGSAFLSSQFTGQIVVASGTTPYYDTYNTYGAAAFGGSGEQGGEAYFVVEQISGGLSPDVLEVYGNETIYGGLTVDTSGIKIKGPANSSSLLTSTVTGGGSWQLNVRNGLNVSEGLSGADANFSGLVQAQAGVTVGTPGITINGVFGTTSQLTTTSTQPDGDGEWRLNLSNGLNVTQGLSGSYANFSGNVSALDLIATSDRRLKQNVVTIDSALEKVQKLRGVYFNRLNSEKRNLGVIAQEVEEILPEVVFTDDTPEQMKSVAYGNIVGLLIEAIKEQQEMINKLM